MSEVGATDDDFEINCAVEDELLSRASLVAPPTALGVADELAAFMVASFYAIYHSILKNDADVTRENNIFRGRGHRSEENKRIGEDKT
ncbi:hypothetical protein ACHAXS_012650 [Conticribra weissflogii]